MGGLFGAQKVENETKVELSPEQKELMKTAMPFFRQFADQGVTLPGGSGIVGFNPLQDAAQGMVLQGAEKQQDTVDAAKDYNDWLFSGGALDVNNNPGLRGAIDAATRPIYEQLTTSVLPGIRGEASTTGNFGSSRQGIAEGLAARGAASAAGDAASNIAFQGYNAGLEATGRANALLPQTLMSYNMPAQGVGTIGDIQRSMDQALLNETRNRFLQEQLLPLQMGQEMLGAVGAIPSAGTTSTSTGPGTNPLSAMLGIGSLFLGGMGGGSGLGSLLGIL